MNTQALADFGTQFLATLAGRLEELSRTLDTAPPDLTRDDGREVAQVVADAFTTGTGVLILRPAGRGLACALPGHALTLADLRGELEVAGRDLLPGDRLAGGQVSDGAGQTVAKVLRPDVDLVGEGDWVIVLEDGRPFVIDPDRPFHIRRP